MKKNWKLLTGLLTATGVCLALGICAIAGVFATDTTQTGTKTLGDGTAVEETISTKDTNVTMTVITDIGEGKMKAHYSIPSGSTVTIDGNVLTVAGKTITAAPAQSGYETTWSIATGTAITADTTVTATCISATYTVTFNGTHCTSNGASTVTKGVDYVATLYNTLGDELGGSLDYSSISCTITIGGVSLSSGYLFTTGAVGTHTYILTIYSASITGDIVINATGSGRVMT